jgi:amino acid permease
MKTKTILKTIGFFIGWLLSFQLIGVGTHLMSQPSNISFTFGIVCYGLIVVSIFICAYKFTQSAAQLVTEYRENKEVKQEKEEKL